DLNTQDLTQHDADRLAADHLAALAAGTASIRYTDRGAVELRLGTQLFTAAQSSGQPRPYQPDPACPELVLALSPAAEHALRRQRAAPAPAEHVHGRVLEAGWLRHLHLDGGSLETVLGLPAPGPVETAAQVYRLIRSSPAAVPRLQLVRWTDTSGMAPNTLA